METVTILGITAGKLVFAGTCLGIGFWASKRITGLADIYLIKLDEKRMKRLASNPMEA